MKISLLTIWHICNYGAEMQTYATVKALKQLGHEVQVLDYRLHEPQRAIDKALKCISTITPVHRKFNSFWNEYIPHTKHITNAEDLTSIVKDSNVVLVGSDQVWNPDITCEKSLEFFLSFVPEGIRRCSYASSIGVSKWTTNENLTKQIAYQLSKFDKVSCRESDGVEILRKIFNIDATNVLDPTLLFDGYPELIGEVKQKNTFVYYPLLGGQEMIDFCQEAAKRLNMEYVNNNPVSTWIRGRVWDRQSVQEWILNFAEAKVIATQSFHGTAFSIIHGKQFFTVYNGSKVSRIANLLDALGIRDRLFPTVEAAREAKPWEKPIDYTEVNKKLSALRETSWDFLRSI